MCLWLTIPFITMGIYVSLIFLPFFSIIIGYGIVKLMKILKRNSHIFALFFILFILISSGFTIFMNTHWNRSITSQPMTEQAYSTGIYMNINTEGTSVCNNGLTGTRLASISEKPCLPLGGAHAAWYPPDLLIYDFANIEDYTFTRISFDAVILTQSDYLYTTDFGVNANFDWTSMMIEEVNSKKNVQLFNRYGIEQAVEYIPEEKTFFYWSHRDSAFFISLYTNKYVLYDNGEQRIWYL
jgi:hypothetical protein